MSVEWHALANFLLAVTTLTGSAWLLGFFQQHRADQMFRAFWWFFVIMTVAFLWLALADWLTLTRSPWDLTRSPWRATIVRSLFAAATWHLAWTLRR